MQSEPLGSPAAAEVPHPVPDWPQPHPPKTKFQCGFYRRPCCATAAAMLRNRAIFVGFGDCPANPKNPLEIQGFVPRPVGRCRAFRISISRAS